MYLCQGKFLIKTNNFKLNNFKFSLFYRARVNEMIGVLKALGTLISALKKAPKDSS